MTLINFQIDFTNFSAANIKDVFSRNLDVVIVWCGMHWFDNTTLSKNIENFTQKTWEELGLKELYDEYMNSKPKK